MNDIAQYQSKAPTRLSVQVQKKLDPQLARIYYTKELARWIIDQESDTFSYSVWKAVSTLLVTESLIQSYPGDLPPHLEELYSQATKGFLNSIHQITEEAAAKFVAELDRIPSEVCSGSIIEDIRLAIGRILQQ